MNKSEKEEEMTVDWKNGNYRIGLLTYAICSVSHQTLCDSPQRPIFSFDVIYIDRHVSTDLHR